MPGVRLSRKLALLPRPDLPATTDAVAAPQTVATVDTAYLQTLLGYNARRVSLLAIELFAERMAAYGLSLKAKARARARAKARAKAKRPSRRA